MAAAALLLLAHLASNRGPDAGANAAGAPVDGWRQLTHPKPGRAPPRRALKGWRQDGDCWGVTREPFSFVLPGTPLHAQAAHR